MSRPRTLLALAVLLVSGLLALCWLDPSGVGGSLAHPGRAPDARLAEQAEARPAADGEAQRPPSAPSTADATPRAPALADASAAWSDELRGVVVDGQGAPVPDATVRLVLRPGIELPLLSDPVLHAERIALAEARSDAHGAFHFAVPCGRTLELCAEKDGYADGCVAHARCDGDARLVLERPATLSGRVLHARDGSPVSDATIEVYHAALARRVAVARAGAEGVYRVEGLPAGAVTVLALPAGRARARYESELAPGTEHTLDLLVDEGLALTGEVLDATTRQPIEGAEVTIGAARGERTVTDARGRYRLLGVDPRSEPRVEACAPGYGRQRSSRPTLSAGQLVADIELRPARRARGRIVDDRGRAVSGAYVAAIGSSPGEEDPGHPLGSREEPDVVSAARSGPDGRFECADLNADARHFLLARLLGYADALLPFPADEPTQAVLELGDVRLERAATVSGIVVASEAEAARARDAGFAGLAGVDITLQLDVDLESAGGPWVGRNPLVASFRQARSDARGRFALTDLGPGHFRLSFARRGQRPLEPVYVDLAAGQRLDDLVIVLPDQLSIAGRVLDPWGAPLARALVTLEGGGEPRASSSDSDGRFVFEGLSAGKYALQARLDEGQRSQTDAPALFPARRTGVAPGGAELVLQLARAVAIEGRVLAEDGAGLDHAGVEARASDGELVSSCFADEQGRFLLPVPEGSRVDLRAVPARLLSAERPRRWTPLSDSSRSATRRDVAAGTREVELRLGPLR